ncbi:MAG: DnaJ domain-containing protein [Bacteroidia bacterium]|nr:DnaJ domain-containing protein [Bacteroidia bacterium]
MSYYLRVDMTFSEYYQILGLPDKASIDDIKKAYRQKARLYHPDINHSPEAKDLFILATEAYDFLIANHSLASDDNAAYHQAMEDWRKYRQDRSHQRATVYARASYVRFKKTKFYKTTRILDGTSIIISLIVSVLVIFYTITGYIYRLKHPLEDVENPSVVAFILLLTIGMLFFVISLIYLKAYIETSKKHSKKSK